MVEVVVLGGDYCRTGEEEVIRDEVIMKTERHQVPCQSHRRARPRVAEEEKSCSSWL